MEPRPELEEQGDRVARSGLFVGLQPFMAATSVALVFGFVAYTSLDVERAGIVFGAARDWIAQSLAGYYVAMATLVLVMTLGLMVSPYGRLRLGGEGEEPEFSNFTWIAMLFSAGLGIGLLFWSIAEPITHLAGNPFADMEGIASNTPEAANVALRISIFHWGLHGWAFYAFIGLVMAYFAYRKNLPLTIRSSLYPFIGDRIYGPAGHIVDLLALLGTVFGTATSLGLGASQMSTGLGKLFGIEPSVSQQIILIAIISAAATLSAVSGLRRGIRLLSEWNVRLSIVLLVFMLAAGPTVHLLKLLAFAPWDYLCNVIQMGVWVDLDPNASWQGAWTLFYWGWWISWGPFVGMFIARISRGRTIRGFLVGAVLVPTLLSLIWLCLFGGTALNIELLQSSTGLARTVSQDMTLALYRTLDLMDVGLWTWPAGALATALITTWFVTSADSMTLVVCTILSLGNPHPPRRHRIFWGTTVGVVAAALLLAGGLQALQTASIVAALPFSIVMLIMAAALFRSLAQESSDGTR